MIPVFSIHINTNLIDRIELSANWHTIMEAGLKQKYYSQGVQMGTAIADYIERKKTGMNCVKRMVWQNDSGCNVTSHNIRPERTKLCEAKCKVWEDTCYPKIGSGSEVLTNSGANLEFK